MARRRSGFAGRPRGRGRRRRHRTAQVAVQERVAPAGPVEIPAVLTVGDLSELIATSPVETIKLLMRRGLMLTVNDPVDFGNAAAIAAELGVKVLRPEEREESVAGTEVGVDNSLTEAAARPRPPVIAVLGHVDHGKTTLLDSIRGSAVVATEAGGITQSIGAYQVRRDGQTLTFIDTPGHEAFTTMRARGAQVTDIVVLVVAADDGLMPQTLEAIDHARAAGVPIVVAINKIDIPAADAERVRRELAERDLLVESWGGDVVAVEVSALRGDGVQELLESLQLVAEVLELKADPDRPGLGACIEAHIDSSRGPLASIILRTGTARLGDDIVVGRQRGRIRDMVDGFGEHVEEAGPSAAIEIMGLSGLPVPGDQLEVVENERAARKLVEERQRAAQREGGGSQAATMAEVMRRLNAGDAEELLLVIKTATQGSIDAVRRSAEQVSDQEVQINLLRAATGSVNEGDVMLAMASGAIIMAFEAGVEAGAARQAAIHGVDIRRYNVIYNLIDDISTAARGLLAPIERDVVLGHALVQAIFPAGRRDKAAGVRVTDGQLTRSAQVRVMRDGEVVHSGSVSSLRRFRDDVRELANGFEGGVGLEGYNDFVEGDILEAFEVQFEARS